MSVAIEHITAAACPECGCEEVRKVEISNQHSSGEWNERVKFGCGLELHYSPNMHRTTVENDCNKSGRAAEWKARRIALASVMVEALTKEVVGLSLTSRLSLERSLASDLDIYRDELEQVKP